MPALPHCSAATGAAITAAENREEESTMPLMQGFARFRAARCLGLGIAAAAVMAGTAKADDVADFYHGKTLQFIVGYPPSGGYYAYAQLLTRFLGKHIPGQPTVILQNMPGASSLRSVQYMLSVAAKDGLTIGRFNRGLLPQSKMKPQEVNVDFSQLTWIGSMANDVAICTLWGAKGVATFAQLRESHVIIGDTSKNSGGYIYASILHSLAPDNTRTILGYGSSGDVWLAMEKGEVDGNCNVWSSMKSQRPQWFAQHKANILVQFSKVKLADLPNVPTVFEFATSDNQRKALDFLMAAEAISRPVAGPPGIPADRIKALREAFMATMKDPELIAAANEEHMELAPIDGEEAAKIAAHIAHSPADAIELAKKMTDIE
jgi:tripartite-type tricarboxylate transporter receptor subunit TctC